MKRLWLEGGLPEKKPGAYAAYTEDGPDIREGEHKKNCPVCGQAWPEYLAESEGHIPLGCERCLIIRRNGVIQ